MSKENSYPDNFIRYIGTGGGRFSMIRQQRGTGGIWIGCRGLSGIIDPGPGSLAHICAANPTLLSDELDFVMLTHKHVDHSTDANVLIECMTQGGFEKKGTIIAPSDALFGDDRVIMKYSQRRAERIHIPRDGSVIDIGNGLAAEAVEHLHHGVECYGYIFRAPGVPEWGMISDSRMLPSFAQRYKNCEFISMNVTFPDRKKHLDHISIEEAKELLSQLNVKNAVFTHLGAMMTSPEGRHFLEDLDTERTDVTAARDGMVVDLETHEISFCGENFPASAPWQR
ncbi:MBL fold metallo-hydrolase [Synergistes jonesii]|uniref:MBL fold metallo-hydrolase n=1 Tax=Synergistes jonesii TaxID=2754 RepID=UPI003333195B